MSKLRQQVASEGDAAAGRLQEVSFGAEPWEALPLVGWASALVEAAFLQCLKRRAAAAENYKLAADLKSHEASLDEAVAAERRKCLRSLANGWGEIVESIARRKCEAAENEDYRLAAELKRVEQELRAEPPPEVGELDRVLAEKQRAVEAEDFGRAAALKTRQLELEAAGGRFEKWALKRAVSRAADAKNRGALLRGPGMAAAHAAACADEAAWAEATASLRARASALAPPI